jgi:hypothetical protein
MAMVLKKGARGDQVKGLQKLLNRLPSTRKKLVEDGIFGQGTLDAIIASQKSAGLIADGIVGQKTWSALASAGKTSNLFSNTKLFNPQAPLADIAASYIGVKETGNNLAGKSKELLAIFNADNLAPNGKTDGYPWCAAFVSFCIQKLNANSSYYNGLIPPREAAVSRFLSIWAKSNGCLIFDNKSINHQPQKGDIVVFIFSHIGITESVNGGTIKTIEGNTNDAGSREGNIVARKNRAKSLIKAYIRLPISTSRALDLVNATTRTC